MGLCRRAETATATLQVWACGRSDETGCESERAEAEIHAKVCNEQRDVKLNRKK